MFSQLHGIKGDNRQQIRSLEAAIQASEGEINIFESTRTQECTNFAVAQTSANDLQTPIAAADEKINSANAQLSAANSALSAANSIPGEPIIDDETGEVIGMDYSARDAAIAQANAEIAEANSAIEAATQERDRLNAEYQAMLEDISLIETMIADIDNGISTLDAEITNNQAEISRLEAEDAAKEASEVQKTDSPDKTESVATPLGILATDEASEQEKVDGVKTEEEIQLEEVKELLDTQAIEQLYSLASKYTDREDLTLEEYGEIIALEQITNNYNQLYSQFGIQLSSEGTADDIYNTLKEITGLGITREMVEEDFNRYEGIQKSLQAQINGDTEEAQKIVGEEFAKRLSNCESVEDTWTEFLNYCGDEDKAMEAFNDFVSNNTNITNATMGGYYNEFRIAEQDGNYLFQIKFANIPVDTNNLTEDGFVSYDLDNVPIPVESIFQNMEITPDSLQGIIKSGPSDFSSMYKFWTGVEYDQENIQNYNREALNYSQVNTGLATAYHTEQMLQNTTPETAFEAFVDMYDGDEDTAIQAFNNYYETLLTENNEEVTNTLLNNKLTGLQARKNDEGELEFLMRFEPYKEGDTSSLYNFSTYNGEEDYFEFVHNPQDEMDKLIQLSQEYDSKLNSEYQLHTNDLSSINMLFWQMNTDVASNSIIQQRFENTYFEQTGKTKEDVIDNYNESYDEAFGKSELKDTLSSYIHDMDSYAQKLSAAISISSIGASFFCPVLGIGAIAGSFTDNAIDGWNMATNEVKGENWQDLVGDTLQEASLIAIGMGIGKLANSANTAITNYIGQNSSKLAAHAAGMTTEVVIDAGLGMGVDYLTTGDLNLSGNGLSVFLDIMSGVRGYKALDALSSKKADVDVPTTKTGVEVKLPPDATSGPLKMNLQLFGGLDEDGIIRAGSPDLDDAIPYMSKANNAQAYRFNPNGSIEDILANNPRTFLTEDGKIAIPNKWDSSSPYIIDPTKEQMIMLYGGDDFAVCAGDIFAGSYVDRKAFDASKALNYQNPESLNFGEVIDVTKQAPGAFKEVPVGTKVETLEGLRTVNDGEVIAIDHAGNPYVTPKSNILKRNLPIDGDSTSINAFKRLSQNIVSADSATTVGDAALKALADKEFRIATAGYSAAPEGYEAATREFLSRVNAQLGDSEVGFVTSPTADKGSIDAITTEVAGTDKSKLFYVTAEDYVEYINPDNFPSTIDKDAYSKIQKFVLGSADEYSRATAEASNLFIATGGRNATVSDFVNAIQHGNSSVIVNNQGLDIPAWGEAKARVENAPLYLREQINAVKAGKDLPYPEVGGLTREFIQSHLDVLSKQARIIDVDPSSQTSMTNAVKSTVGFIRRQTVDSAKVSDVAGQMFSYAIGLKDSADTLMRGLLSDAGIDVSNPSIHSSRIKGTGNLASLENKILRTLEHGENDILWNAIKETNPVKAVSTIFDMYGARFNASSQLEIDNAFENLLSSVKSGKIVPTYVANYHGNGISPIFSEAQIKELNKVTDLLGLDVTYVTTEKVDGYTGVNLSAQLPNSGGLPMEFQMRTQSLDLIANNVSHYSYDVFNGKDILAGYPPEKQEILKPIVDAFQSFQSDTVKRAKYNEYMTACYNAARNNSSQFPSATDYGFSDLISVEKILEIDRLLHAKH